MRILAAFFAFAACAQEVKPGAHEWELESGKDKRTVRVFIPKKYSTEKPAPLVIDLHGMTANGLIQDKLSQMNDIAEREGFVVAYPDGLNKMWRYWKLPAGPVASRLAVDDIKFLGELIDWLVKKLSLDSKRVYVCGISNGAFMTSVLACEYADKIAAVAMVAGPLTIENSKNAKPARKMPVMYFQGTEDSLVSVDGGEIIGEKIGYLSAEENAKWWAQKNGCKMEPKMEKVPDKADDGTKVTKYTYESENAPVIFYKIEGGGHTWPGGSPQPEKMLGKTCRDIDASALMWEFFSRFKLEK